MIAHDADPKPVSDVQTGLASKTLRALGWSFSNSGIKTILRIGILAVLARLITPAEFGLITAAMLVMDLVSTVYQSGFGDAIVQRRDLTKAHVRSAFTLCLGSGVFFTGVVYLASPAVSRLFGMPDLQGVLKALSFLLFFNALGTVARALLQRRLAFDRLSIADMVSKAVGYGCTGIIMALMGYGVWALVAAALGYRILLTSSHILMERHSFVPLIDTRAIKELFHFGGGISLASLLNLFAQEGDNFIVGRWLGPAALGIYGRAYALLRMPLYLFGKVLNEVLFSSFSQIQNDRARMGAVYLRGTYIIGVVVLPISVLSFVMAPEIVSLLLGEQWSGVVGILKVFAIGMLFRTAYPYNGTLARSAGAVYPLAARQGIYAVLVIIGAWFGRPWGVEGVAVGVTMAVIVQYLMVVQLSLKIVGMNWGHFIRAHAHVVVILTIAVIESVTLATALRSLGFPAIIILGTAVASLTLSYLVGAIIMPRTFLGTNGVWVLRLMLKSVPSRMPLAGHLRRKLAVHA